MPCASIIDSSIQHLVNLVDNETHLETVDRLLAELVGIVRANCQKSAIQERYRLLAEKSHGVPLPCLYPLDKNGYACAFDPVEEEEAFLDAWSRYGFIVGKSLVSKKQCQQAVERIKTVLDTLSDGKYDITKPETYGYLPKDEQGLPCISRGFFELYHDDSLAQLRQSVRLWLHHVLLWGRADLWTSFDRFGIKTQDQDNAPGLPLHVDQNPLVHPYFKTTQGVLALVDCPVEQGTFVGVGGSRNLFNRYVTAIEKHDAAYRGEYVEAGWNLDLDRQLRPFAQPIPLEAGNLVSWDSRTTHGNSPNLLTSPRFVAYISYGPTRETVPGMRERRLEALNTGIGQNMREALMHASKPPRCSLAHSFEPLRNKEQLTYLGKLLYGTSLWSSAV